MLTPKRFFIAIGLFFIFMLFAFYIFSRQAVFSRGAGSTPQTFEVREGEGVKEIGENLEEARLVKNRYYFDYYIWKTKGREKIQAGKYEISGSMTVPEIVQVFSLEKSFQMK